MTDKHIQSEAPHSNMEKDPSDWVTGDEPMTGAQKSYLKTLSEEAGVEFDETLNKAEASEQIDALQKTTGRGTSHGARQPNKKDTGDDADTVAKVHTASKSVAKGSKPDSDGTDAAPEADLFDSEDTTSEH